MASPTGFPSQPDPIQNISSAQGAGKDSGTVKKQTFKGRIYSYTKNKSIAGGKKAIRICKAILAKAKFYAKVATKSEFRKEWKTERQFKKVHKDAEWDEKLIQTTLAKDFPNIVVLTRNLPELGVSESEAKEAFETRMKQDFGLTVSAEGVTIRNTEGICLSMCMTIARELYAQAQDGGTEEASFEERLSSVVNPIHERGGGTLETTVNQAIYGTLLRYVSNSREEFLTQIETTFDSTFPGSDANDPTRALIGDVFSSMFNRTRNEMLAPHENRFNELEYLNQDLQTLNDAKQQIQAEIAEKKAEMDNGSLTVKEHQALRQDLQALEEELQDYDGRIEAKQTEINQVEQDIVDNDAEFTRVLDWIQGSEGRFAFFDPNATAAFSSSLGVAEDKQSAFHGHFENLMTAIMKQADAESISNLRSQVLSLVSEDQKTECEEKLDFFAGMIAFANDQKGLKGDFVAIPTIIAERIDAGETPSYADVQELNKVAMEALSESAVGFKDAMISESGFSIHQRVIKKAFQANERLVGLSVSIERSLGPSGNQSDSGYLNGIKDLNDGVFELTLLTEGGGGHATMVMKEGEEVFFFDPNYGLIECDKDDPKSTILTYMEKYKGPDGNKSHHRVQLHQIEYTPPTASASETPPAA